MPSPPYLGDLGQPLQNNPFGLEGVLGTLSGPQAT